jgi:signal transduction histidine kinase
LNKFRQLLTAQKFADANMKTKFGFPKFISICTRYCVTLGLIAAAVLLTDLIWFLVKPLSSPLFLMAIIVAARQYGFCAGMAATIVSGLAIDYFFIQPYYDFTSDVTDATRLLIFSLEGGMICWLVVSRAKFDTENRLSREQLQALSRRQQTLLEEERKRIALEIHDELGQSLTGLKMGIHLLNHPNVETKAHEEKIGELLKMVDMTIAAVRRISTELRPPVLDDLGLMAAIEWQTQEFERRTGISCLLKTNFDNLAVDSTFATGVFRIYQETLTNITRHAAASRVKVEIKKTNCAVVLRVQDNGRGIELEDIGGKVSLGILGMRERARLIGGEIEIRRGSNGRGTIVELTAPLPANI